MMFYLYKIKNLAIQYFENWSINILFCVNDVAFANDEAIRKNSDEYFFQYIIISLIDELLNNLSSSFRILRLSYWHWLESSRKLCDEDDSSRLYDLTQWRRFTFDAIIVKRFVFWKKLFLNSTLIWNILIIVVTDYNKKCKQIKFMSIEFSCLKCLSTILSRFCHVKNMKNLFVNYI